MVNRFKAHHGFHNFRVTGRLVAGEENNADEFSFNPADYHQGGKL
jgi:hypothetical protein